MCLSLERLRQVLVTAVLTLVSILGWLLSVVWV